MVSREKEQLGYCITYSFILREHPMDCPERCDLTSRLHRDVRQWLFLQEKTNLLLNAIDALGLNQWTCLHDCNGLLQHRPPAHGI